jgi:hypothetical protein
VEQLRRTLAKPTISFVRAPHVDVLSLPSFHLSLHRGHLSDPESSGDTV